MTPAALASTLRLAAAWAEDAPHVAERLVFDLARRLIKERHTPRVVAAPRRVQLVVHQGGKDKEG